MIVSMPLIVLSEHEKYSYIWSISKDLYRDADYSTPIEVFNITDPRFFTTSDDRSLLAETLVVAGKTVVATVVGGSVAFMLFAVAIYRPWALPKFAARAGLGGPYISQSNLSFYTGWKYHQP